MDCPRRMWTFHVASDDGVSVNSIHHLDNENVPLLVSIRKGIVYGVHLATRAVIREKTVSLIPPLIGEERDRTALLAASVQRPRLAPVSQTLTA